MPLGRGLESLIPPIGGDKEKKQNIFVADEKKFEDHSNDFSNVVEPKRKNNFEDDIPQNKKFSESIFLIEVDKIKPNPHQPRRTFDESDLRELSASIREYGVIQPLVVSKIEEETDNGTIVEYQLIAGERRLKAAKMAGLERVPAIIRRIVKEIEGLELAIIENLQRSDLNPVETARAYAKLQDEFKLTQREIAVKMSKSREAIANSLRLLNLPSEIQEAIENGKLNESQARLLLSVVDPVEQRRLFREIVEKGLSVRDLQSRMNDSGKTKKQIDVVKNNPEFIDWEERLSDYFGTKVKIEKSEKGGKIVISFFSPEEIANIIDKIKPEE